MLVDVLYSVYQARMVQFLMTNQAMYSWDRQKSNCQSRKKRIWLKVNACDASTQNGMHFVYFSALWNVATDIHSPCYYSKERGRQVGISYRESSFFCSQKAAEQSVTLTKKIGVGAGIEMTHLFLSFYL